MGISRIWFTSDTHAYHENIIRYSNRPFDDVHIMNQCMADNLNSVVQPNDTLYHLGDVSSWRGEGQVEEFRRMIKCKNIHLVFGNHDHQLRKMAKNDSTIFHSMFASWHDLLEIKVGDQPIILCHFALRTWNKQHYDAWHLYGHSHGSLPDDPNSLSIDVGVDTELFGHKRFMPYSYDEIRAIMKKHKVWKPVDHHTGKLANYERAPH